MKLRTTANRTEIAFSVNRPLYVFISETKFLLEPGIQLKPPTTFPQLKLRRLDDVQRKRNNGGLSCIA